MAIVARVIAYGICLLTLLGLGYLVTDKALDSRRRTKAAPFGDTHYESVKQTFDHATDADTPDMVAERQRLIGK